MRTLITLVFLMFVTAAPAFAQQAPREVVSRMSALTLTCRMLGGQPVRGPKPVAQPIDLTGDGRTDWVFDERAFACQNKNSGQVRPIGNRVAVLVDNGTGKMDPAWEGRPADLVVTSNPAAVFITEDAQCASRPDPLACTRILRWDAASKRMIASADLPRRGGPDPQKGASSASSAGGRDVTAAGFPFRVGVYTVNGQCNPNAGGLHELKKTYIHEWEADGGDHFRKILEIAPGKYRISEQSDYVEFDDPRDPSTNPIEDLEYERVSATSFRRTRFKRWDERTQRLVPGKTVQTFTFCRPFQAHER